MADYCIYYYRDINYYFSMNNTISLPQFSLKYIENINILTREIILQVIIFMFLFYPEDNIK